jgi:IclR family acetate operon transcriptional repressor
MGKAILAFSATDLKEAVGGLGELTRFTPQTLASRSKLLADLELTQDRGYSVNLQERYAGVCAVAAPVLDSRGRARAAVGVQGPTARLSAETVPHAAQHVLATAQAVARLLPLDHL